jgi:3-oxoacyl-[acyl-carrier protein] reductase
VSSEPRVVIVTGGSRGLGAGIVQSYLDSGDLVATCSRSITAEVEKWQQELPDRFLFVPADLSKPADCETFVKAVIDRWDHVDVLVNNAGVARDGILGMASDDDIDTVVDLNLKGTLYMSRLVSRRMLTRRSGNIVNISSIVGRSGYRGLTVYSATKAAQEGLTRALARELGSRGIRVNAIAPGPVDTEDMRESISADDDRMAELATQVPLGRLGREADFGAAAVYLASPASGWVTGHVLVVSGGAPIS